jgi:molecular chaperone GrpE (heat shock protein)
MNMQDRNGGPGGDGQARNQAATETPKEAVQSSVNEAKEVASEAIETAKHAAEDVAATAKHAADDLTAEARRVADDAREKAMHFAEDNKQRAAEQISGVTMALKKAADELDNNDQRQVAKYARDFAGGLEKLSTNLREKGVDELAGSVTSFARSQPAAFIGAAALLGFAASRFAKSSSRPDRDADDARPSASYSPVSPAGRSNDSTWAQPGGSTASQPGSSGTSQSGPGSSVGSTAPRPGSPGTSQGGPGSSIG